MVETSTSGRRSAAEEIIVGLPTRLPSIGRQSSCSRGNRAWAQQPFQMEAKIMSNSAVTSLKCSVRNLIFMPNSDLRPIYGIWLFSPQHCQEHFGSEKVELLIS